VSETELYVPEIPALHLYVIAALMVTYALYRGSSFHPVNVKGYGTWLARTPWRFPMPLPLGPVHLVWQDVVVVLALTSLTFLPPRTEASLLCLPLGFLMVYCWRLGLTLFRLEVRWATILLILLSALAVLLARQPWYFLPIVAAIYGVTYFGISRSLRDFPYTEKERAALGLVPFEQLKPPEVSLPIMPASDSNLLIRIGTREALLVGTLVGVIFFSAAFHFRNEQGFDRGILMIYAVIVSIVMVGRVLVYISGYRAPISLLGRIATRRFIIPGYDRVFAAPLTMAIVSLLLPPLLIVIGVSPLFAVSISLAVIVSLALALPPRIEDWIYTGHYRIPAIRRVGQNFVET
jgi:hypothetical protein